jgi:glyoxylase-like metal-dependent hydrolase (beta-lactamase superfamily II)
VTVLNTVTGCSATDDPAAPATDPSAAPPSDWKRVNLSFVSAYLLVRGGEVAIVDLGTPGSAAAIEEGLKAAGTDWDAVKHIVLTHKHDDHAGSLAEVEPLVKATWYAGPADIASLGQPFLKAVNDNDEVFGLRIIDTPGHTVGHISVLDPSTGTLVAGDALRTTDGLLGPDPQHTENQLTAATSVKKLAGLDVRTILPGHGDPLTQDAAGALKELAASL